jgi:hypothetical protein
MTNNDPLLVELATKPAAQENSQFGLLETLEERQRRILSRLPRFFKVTALVGTIGFLITSILQVLFGKIPKERVGLFSISQPTLGAIIAWLLTLFSILVMWLFVIWSLTFVPFIAYQAFRSSQKHRIPVGTKAFRWVQLYAATFLPMAIFAVAWNSAASGSFITAEITSLKETLLVVIGAVAVSGLLYLINYLIPTRLVAVRLSLLSSLLFTSLFLAYGWGYSLASYFTLFGILFYLTFGSSQIEETGRSITTYDIDPKVAIRLNEISTKRQELRTTHDEIKAQEMESEAKRLQHQQEIKSAQIENDSQLGEQLSHIHKAKTEFNRQTNEVQLSIFHKKHVLLSKMYEILSTELSGRMDEQIPKRIEELKNSAKDISPKDLYDQMNQLMNQINAGLEGLPESLEDLRHQMLDAAREIEKQTLQLAEESTKSSTDGSQSQV